MKKSILLGLFMTILVAQAQLYFTRAASVSFYSTTPVENIEAQSETGQSAVDFNTGNLEFSVAIASFHFEKALMQEHFNENYMESEDYPTAVFKGQLLDFESDGWKEGEMRTFTLNGTLNIKGIEKVVVTNITLTKTGENYIGNAEFTVSPDDFEIEIPSVVKDKIAQVITITVVGNYAPYKR